MTRNTPVNVFIVSLCDLKGAIAITCTDINKHSFASLTPEENSNIALTALSRANIDVKRLRSTKERRHWQVIYTWERCSCLSRAPKKAGQRQSVLLRSLWEMWSCGRMSGGRYTCRRLPIIVMSFAWSQHVYSDYQYRFLFETDYIVIFSKPIIYLFSPPKPIISVLFQNRLYIKT